LKADFDYPSFSFRDLGPLKTLAGNFLDHSYGEILKHEIILDKRKRLIATNEAL